MENTRTLPNVVTHVDRNCLCHVSVCCALQNRKDEPAAREPHATIGITVYPPYPLEAFPDAPPYTCKNGGDWTWFGGRMVQALVANGLVKQGYTEISPMVDRVLKNNGFYEWYDVKTGDPKFRGSAGVLYDAIQQLRTWAQAHSNSRVN